MKNTTRFIALTATLLAGTTAFSASLPVAEKRAVEVSISSIGNEIDAAAYNSAINRISARRVHPEQFQTE